MFSAAIMAICQAEAVLGQCQAMSGADIGSGLNSLAGLNLNDYMAARNAYVPPPCFPRSPQELDAIMLRRYEMRQKIHNLRLLKRAAVIVAGPVLVCAVIKLWEFSVLWIVQ